MPNVGDRIRLIRMPHDPDPILPGSLGTVTGVFDHPELGQIQVDWDNGRFLALATRVDTYEIIG